MKELGMILLLAAFSIVVSAQSKKAYINAAELAYFEKDYYSSLDYYLNASEFDSTDIEISYKVAESARLFNAYNLSQDYYTRVYESDDKAKYPLTAFWLADLNQKQGRFEAAKSYYSIYLSEFAGDDIYFSERAQKEIKACDWAIDLLANPDLSITTTHLGDGINTEYSEFGGIENDEALYFSSLRFMGKNPKSKPAKLISKILKSEDKITAEVIDERLNEEELHTAHTAYNADNSVVYYTICEYLMGAEIRCDIFSREIISPNNYGPETKLPESVNLGGFTNTQPNIGIDPVNMKPTLYFVSDRPSGKGKLDIWAVEIMGNNQFSIARNLSEINTVENDITPFFHGKTNTLYFSSEGYQRLGGYDIYKAENLKSPKHVNVPLNSSFHDLYFTLSDDGKTSFFSSNRPGTKYIDIPQEACCYDIFKADISPVEINLNALTFVKNTQEALLGVTVKLYDAGTGVLIEESFSESGNEHIFELERDKNYLIVGVKDPLKPDSINLSTYKIYQSQDITKRLFLELDEIKLDLFVFDKETQKELSGATIQLIDLSDKTIDDIVVTNEESNRFWFTLQSNRNYKIIAQKEDIYKPASIIINTKTDGGNGTIIRKIYLEPKDLNIYLPLTLFYDNDRPGPKSVARTTKKSYTDTYYPYMERKPVFLNRTARNKYSEERLLSIQSMDDFFEFEVRGGFEKLDLFMTALLDELQKGYSFEIMIKGYASPLAPTRYNFILGQRRISSVRNELQKFAVGALDEYFNNGQLLLTDISYGEELSPTNVSDLPEDLQRSIFSVEASKERRVEIIEIRHFSTNLDFE